jgi:hypothetical protein
MERGRHGTSVRADPSDDMNSPYINETMLDFQVKIRLKNR